MLPYRKLTQKNPSSTSRAAASPSQSGVRRAEVFWGAPLPRWSGEPAGDRGWGAGSDPPQTQPSLKAQQAPTLTKRSMFISHLPAGAVERRGYFWHILSLLEMSVKARNGAKLLGKPRGDCPRHGVMR